MQIARDVAPSARNYDIFPNRRKKKQRKKGKSIMEKEEDRVETSLPLKNYYKKSNRADDLWTHASIII